MNFVRSLLRSIKKYLYFPIAKYFSFWAKFVLARWQPRIIVITGSSGKTTMLNILEAQIGTFARVSHGANSAFGVPLDILGLSGVKGNRLRWITLLFMAPVRGLITRRKEKFYVVEADADRPGEADFLSKLLRPEVTIWVSSSRTHALYFDALAKYKQVDIRQVIADEFANMAKRTSGLVLSDGDNKFIRQALKGELDAKVVLIKKADVLEEFKLSEKQTIIKIGPNRVYSFSQPQPPAVAHQIAFLDEVMKYLEIEPDYEMTRFATPPGRSSVFESTSGATIIDSTYNSNLDSARVTLEMFKEFPGKKKILVLGDMLEQGEYSAKEHEELAKVVADSGISFSQIVIYGHRVKKSTFPALSKLLPKTPITPLLEPMQVADFLETELSGDEVVLFKGAGFLEGVIARMLKNKQDIQYLARRGKEWDKRRRSFGI